MKVKHKLTDIEIAQVKEKANKMRALFGVTAQAPIAKGIRMLVEKQGIIICEYPMPSKKLGHTDAALTLFDINGENDPFIGLNTSLYYDEQLFCLAHELYHYITHTGMAYDPGLSQENEITESMADRFAAELLLPGETIKNRVILEFLESKLENETNLKLFRFIARIQCEWMLPYQAIVKRLYEEALISEKRYNELYAIEVRDKNSDYYKILQSMDSEMCRLLNNRTCTCSVSAEVFDTILGNFEDGLISEEELIEVLEVFKKKPSDFGIDISATDTDDEMSILF